MAYNIVPISLEQTIAALRGGGSRMANAIDAGQAGVERGQAAELEQRKAALAKRVQEAGLFKGSELGQLPQQAGLSIAPDRELSKDFVSDIMSRTSAKPTSSVVPITREQALKISATLPSGAQAQFLAGSEGLGPDKAANLAARLSGIHLPLEVSKEKMAYQQNVDPSRLKTNMFARQSASAHENLNQIEETYGTGLLDQIPMLEQMKSQDRKKFDQARTLFANAILRPETGAVINKGEYADLDRRYIPLPGDTREVLATKRAAREDMVQLLNAVRGGDPDAIARLAELPEAAANKAIRAKRAKSQSPLQKALTPQPEPDYQNTDGIAPEDAEYFQ